MNDLKFAIRQLMKSPAFTLVVGVSIAVGIGANAVVFTWIRSTLLHSIPRAERPAELAVLLPEHRTAGLDDTMSIQDIETLALERGVFAGITASQFGAVQVRHDSATDWLWGQSTLANFFDVLGARPVLGRGFLPGEDRPGAAEHVAVISYELWQRHFQGSAHVLGKVIEINQRPVTIVGVAPPGFVGTMGGLRLDLWVPLATQYTDAELEPRFRQRSFRWLHTVARLAPGISHRKANAAVAAVSERLSQSFPEANRNTTLRVRHLWESTWGGQSLFLPLLRVLAVVAGLLLLLVIANVANLLLARAQGRQLEMGVRVALGASPFRIMRQLLVESICLALVGGAGGIALAVWGANALFDLMPTTYLPVGYDVSLNWTVVALITGLTISTGILFGLAPAVQAAGTNLNETLKAGARTSSGLGPRQWLRRAFVIGQVGLAFVLLLGMGLCVRSFIRARQIELGVDPRGVWVAGFKLSPHVGDSNAVRSFYQRLQYEAARLPGVEQVALADWLPLGFEGGSGVGVKIPGYVPAPGEDMGAGISYVSPGYFDVLHIRRVSGRDFTPADDAQAPLVGVVNETFARKFFGARDPVGLTFNCSRGDVRIVGVVQTGRYRTLNEREQPYMYLSTWQSDVRTLTLALRTAGDPKQLAQPVERVAVAIHPLAAPTAAMTYEDYVAAAFTTPRLAATLLSLLGVLALALAILGLFAVMSQNVEQRIREMGIRLALGAQPRELRRLIVQQGLWLTAAGLVLGGITGFAVSRLLSGLLVGISAADVVTWVLVPLLLLGAAMGTCWGPARRASKVNPMVALRTE